MKKVIKFLEDKLPILWGWLWFGIITIGSFTLLVVVIKWCLTVLGVL